MERGLDYWNILETDVFELVSLLGSFNRKQELDNARQWFSSEVRKLMDANKPKDQKSSSGSSIQMQPVNQDMVLDDLIASKFEN